ncbi:MFS transporter [Nocardia carnea]|uniref:MFS transporter n=1 Tax=Nocardia carnea TaxID=37328 RepID=UPI002456DC57|nr:MFS transporter [Nocardia carnea]
MATQTMGTRREISMLVVLSLSVSAVLLGTTILNVALPELRIELETNNTQQQWILNAYTLTFAGFLLVAGAIGDRYGLRRTLLSGLAGFSITTTVAAFAQGPGLLIVMRGLSGVFAAAIMPISLAVIVRTFSKERVPGAVAAWAASSGLAIALGPLLGGAFLSAGMWWGSVLLVVSAGAFLAFLGVILTVPETGKSPTSGQALRLAPVATSIAGIALLVWGVLRGGQDSEWLAAHTLLPIITGVIVLGGLVAAETRHKNPLVETELFKRPQFTCAVVALTLGTFAVYGYLYFTTFYLQVQRGFSPIQTGLLLIPLSAGVVIGGPISRKIAEILGALETMAAGMLLVALSLALLLTQDMRSNIAYWEILTFTTAFGFALVLAPGTTAAMAGVPAAHAGAGSALLNTFRQLGSALGVAVLGSILWSRYQSGVRPQLSELSWQEKDLAGSSLAAALEAGAGRPSVLDGANQSFTSAMHFASATAAGVAALAAIVTLTFSIAIRRRDRQSGALIDVNSPR